MFKLKSVISISILSFMVSVISAKGLLATANADEIRNQNAEATPDTIDTRDCSGWEDALDLTTFASKYSISVLNRKIDAELKKNSNPLSNEDTKKEFTSFIINLRNDLKKNDQFIFSKIQCINNSPKLKQGLSAGEHTISMDEIIDSMFKSEGFLDIFSELENKKSTNKDICKEIKKSYLEFIIQYTKQKMNLKSGLKQSNSPEELAEDELSLYRVGSKHLVPTESFIKIVSPSLKNLCPEMSFELKVK